MDTFAGPGAQLTLVDYAAQKKAATATVLKLNGQPHVSMRKYDVNTGAPAPQLVALNTEVLKAQKLMMETELAALTQLLADIEVAQEVVPQADNPA